ncbi:hypothetical protein KC329_g9 [Hortaea werneckii]|nr:hypothetical protein KC329_g9 [Hortaea werneckii]
MSKCHHEIAEGLADHQGIRRQTFKRALLRALTRSSWGPCTVVPTWLVARIQAELAPTPLEISKKLYVVRLASCQVLPWSVETSSLAVRRLAPTTCALNQYCETPLFMWIDNGSDTGMMSVGHET